MRYIRVTVAPGFFDERSQTAGQYAVYLIVDLGVDGLGRDVIAKCVTSAQADVVLAGLN